MNDEQIWQALVRWLASITSTTVIKAYQSGERPPLPYIAVHLKNVRDVREHPSNIKYEESAGEIIARPMIEREWEFTINAYGEQPTRPLRAISSHHPRCLQQPEQPELPRELVIHDCGKISNEPEFINARWEPRAQMPIWLRAITSDQGEATNIEIIERAGVDIARA